MPLRTTVLSFALGLLVSACGGGGLYNFAREYKPLKAERAHFEATEERVAFEDVKRDPNGFAKVEVGWFGVVTSFADLGDGRQRLGLSLRAHQARHLCADSRNSSCRVTVSDKSLGELSVDVSLEPEEVSGQDRVWMGSLLKVYGKPSGEYDDSGALILDVSYYRHFPRGTYVTTAQRAAMRR